MTTRAWPTVTHGAPGRCARATAFCINDPCRNRRKVNRRYILSPSLIHGAARICDLQLQQTLSLAPAAHSMFLGSMPLTACPDAPGVSWPLWKVSALESSRRMLRWPLSVSLLAGDNFIESLQITMNRCVHGRVVTQAHVQDVSCLMRYTENLVLRVDEKPPRAIPFTHNRSVTFKK